MYKKIISFLLVSLFLTLSFAGCQPENDEDDEIIINRDLICDSSNIAGKYAVIKETGSLSDKRQIDIKLSNRSSDYNYYLIYTNTGSSYRTATGTSGKSYLSYSFYNETVSGVENIELITGLPYEKKERFYADLLKKDAFSTISSSRTLNRLRNTAGRKDYDNITQLYADVSMYSDADELISVTKKFNARVRLKDGTEKMPCLFVADDCFGTSSKKIYKLTQDMVDTLGNNFLKSDDNNDIYDWVTGIYGEEWCNYNNYDNVISDDDTISILLCDIDGDGNSNGTSYTVGYFWAKDNLTDAYVKENMSDYGCRSNEMVMFYIDAVLFAAKTKTETEWSINCKYPSIVLSSLSHEFQHMIFFNQKGMKYNISAETWLNEMCSVVTEDFVADKIGVPGPRGIKPTDYSGDGTTDTTNRLYYFNQYNTTGVTMWNNTSSEDVLKNYSAVFAFGTYLARNYGGIGLFRKIVQNGNKGNIQDVTSAIENVTAGELIVNWGVSQLLSNIETAPIPYRYNNGSSGFQDTDPNYKYGSINLYNYTPKPNIYSINVNDFVKMDPYSNVLAGPINTNENTMNLTVDPEVTVTVTILAKQK